MFGKFTSCVANIWQKRKMEAFFAVVGVIAIGQVVHRELVTYRVIGTPCSKQAETVAVKAERRRPHHERRRTREA